VKEVFGHGDSFTHVFDAWVPDHKLYSESEYVFSAEPHFQRSPGLLKRHDFGISVCYFGLHGQKPYLVLRWNCRGMHGGGRLFRAAAERVHFF